jgi:hypothetical protein
MDALERDDIDLARRTPPAERARQLLELMRVGFRLKRAALRARHPAAADAQIESLFRAWLDGNDRA